MGAIEDRGAIRARPEGASDTAGTGGPAQPVIAWSVAQRAKRGEVVSGDRYVVRHLRATTLVALIDGLGHGANAAEAAERAVQALEAADGTDATLTALVRRCHDALRATRGAVMGLACFGLQLPTMQWLGVGNIEGVVVRADATARPRRERLLVSAGIVGYHLPHLRASTLSLARDDVIVLATDGIHPAFADHLTDGALPRDLDQHLLAHYGHDADDALVLVARYLGGAP
ncbi:MAG TPA: SpoIIE family protein phosphatase [Chloroflexota bacterium]|nr:SpoIIE family protein phosphatase [Chloroflexota bacterium]